MGLANLYIPPPGLDGWVDFWFNNWISHQDIQEAVQSKFGLNNPIYVITPWRQEDMAEILAAHQQYHNDMNSALGLGGKDLSLLDFKDQQVVRQWLWNHYQEHQIAHETLGL